MNPSLTLRSIAGLMASLFLVCALEAQPAPPELNLIQIGQSYRTPMEMVEAFAEARNLEFRSRGFLPPGVPIHAHWRNEKARNFATSYAYRVLCLVPYYDFNETSPAAAAGFFGLALEKNPKVRAYLVNHWPRRSMSREEKQAWIEESLPKFEAMVAEANRLHPAAANPMRLVPRAEAFMDLLAYCEQIPGFQAPATAYNDGGHQSNTANYMFAAMEFAWIFEQSPLGLPAEASKTRRGKKELLFKLTDAQALALQRLAWHHLTSHPLSGVKLPEDVQTPSQVETIEVDAKSRSVTLSWAESTDAGTGVFQYVLKRSDGKTFENVLPRFTDSSVQAGKTYGYRIQAVDFAGNVSQPSREVEAALPRDTAPPKIASVSASANAQTVVVTFDEPVAPSAAQAAHFAIKGLTVHSARLADEKTVILTVSPMRASSIYPLVATSIADRAEPPNLAQTLEASFAHIPPRWEKFNLGDEGKRQVEIEGSQIRITARGEGGFRSFGPMDQPALAGVMRQVKGDFDLPLAITSQGQVAAALQLKPYQRKGNVKTGIVLAEDIGKLDEGSFAVFYLDDSTRFRMTVHRDWLITARVIGAGLSAGDPRKNRNGLNLPVWIRLVREGTQLTGYYSLTGTGADDWEKLGTIDARKMPEKIQLGIFNCSGVADEASTAMLDLRATGQEKSYTNVEE